MTRVIRWCLCTTVFLSCATRGWAQEAPPPEPKSSTRSRLLVMNLEDKGGVSENTRALLNELLLTEFQHARRFEVFGQADITNMLGLEIQRQLAGCADESCLAEVGGALGVDRAVFGSLGLIDDVFLFNLKLVNLQTARVEARVSESVTGGEAKLIQTARAAVATILARAEPMEEAESPTEPVEPTLAKELTAQPGSTTSNNPALQPSTIDASVNETPIYKRWWLWTVVGAAVVGGTAAAVVLTRDGPGSRAQVLVDLPGLQ